MAYPIITQASKPSPFRQPPIPKSATAAIGGTTTLSAILSPPYFSDRASETRRSENGEGPDEHRRRGRRGQVPPAAHWHALLQRLRPLPQGSSPSRFSPYDSIDSEFCGILWRFDSEFVVVVVVVLDVYVQAYEE